MSDYTNEEAKQDQALDDLIDCLTPVEKLIFAEYYRCYSVDKTPETIDDWANFTSIIMKVENAFVENVGASIDYDCDDLIYALSNKGNGLTDCLVNLKIRTRELAERFFTEITGDIDHKISERLER